MVNSRISASPLRVFPKPSARRPFRSPFGNTLSGEVHIGGNLLNKG